MYAKKVDANHAEIRDGLRKAGAWVTDLKDMGQGVPDLLCAPPKGSPLFGEWVLLEVKNPDGSDIKPKQAKFYERAGEYRVRVHIVETLQQALDVVWGRA